MSYMPLGGAGRPTSPEVTQSVPLDTRTQRDEYTAAGPPDPLGAATGSYPGCYDGCASGASGYRSTVGPERTSQLPLLGVTPEPEEGRLDRGVMAMAVFGFLVVGVVAVGCIFFGLYEVLNDNGLFENRRAFGEVLTILGLYFAGPYVVALAAFLWHLIGEPYQRRRRHLVELDQQQHSVFYGNLDQPRAVRGRANTSPAPGEDDLGADAGDALLTGSPRGASTGGSPQVPDRQAASAKRNCLTRERLLGGLVMVIAAAQMGAADGYLYHFVGGWTLAFVALDAALLASIVILRFSRGYGYFYSALLVVKLAVLWPELWRTPGDQLWHPNGVLAILFASIPVVQVPLYAAFFEEAAAVQSGTDSAADVFISNFNLFFSHLLNALDAIALFLVGLVPPDGNEAYAAIPRPFKWLVCIFALGAFGANHATMLFLFYRRAGAGDNVELSVLPTWLRGNAGRWQRRPAGNGGGLWARVQANILGGALPQQNHAPVPPAPGEGFPCEGATHSDAVTTGQPSDAGGAPSAIGGRFAVPGPSTDSADDRLLATTEHGFTDARSAAAETAARQRQSAAAGGGGSQARRMFQYLVLILVVCDVPFIACRLQLWRHRYASLDLFLAKNVKNFFDVIVLLLRAGSID